MLRSGSDRIPICLVKVTFQPGRFSYSSVKVVELNHFLEQYVVLAIRSSRNHVKWGQCDKNMELCGAFAQQ